MVTGVGWDEAEWCGSIGLLGTGQCDKIKPRVVLGVFLRDKKEQNKSNET